MQPHLLHRGSEACLTWAAPSGTARRAMARPGSTTPAPTQRPPQHRPVRRPRMLPVVQAPPPFRVISLQLLPVKLPDRGGLSSMRLHDS
eukprot:628931-Pelagomonas_calceolata.AAC.1